MRSSLPGCPDLPPDLVGTALLIVGVGAVATALVRGPEWGWVAPEGLTVGKLTAVLPVGQSTVSHHLAALAAMGFVQVQRRGTSSLYAVNPR